ncbi:MAG TPA: gamma carbonic anhydrase family protein [Sphingomicrobium sp.]|nr:gamma carbonic anhydrase family protein [Sphingomicrobium sp.]
MPLYAIDDLAPTLGPGAWVAPSADLIGDVRLGTRASVWFGAVIRADNTPIIIGDDSNFQDGAIGHSDPDAPLTVGAGVTVGHQAILHGCTVGEGALIGMGSRVLNGALIGARCILGAGALVTEGKVFEPGMLIVGSPARVVRALTVAEQQRLRVSAAHYAEKAARYATALRIAASSAPPRNDDPDQSHA